MTIEELSWFVDDTVIRKLQGLKGVARVDRNGGVTREIKVEVNPDRGTRSASRIRSDVNRALRVANIDMTGGSGEVGERWTSRSARSAAPRRSPIEALEIPLSGGRKVTLSDIATVTDSWEKPKSFARVNNQTVVSFAIFRGKGESDVEVNHRRRGGRHRAAGRQSGRDGSARSSTRLAYTEGNYDSAMETLIEGAVCCRSLSCSSSCATSAPRWFRRWRCRCRSSRPSGR